MDASELSFCGLLQRKSPLRKANLKILQGGTSLQAPPSAPRHCSLWPKGVKVNTELSALSWTAAVLKGTPGRTVRLSLQKTFTGSE